MRPAPSLGGVSARRGTDCCNECGERSLGIHQWRTAVAYDTRRTILDRIGDGPASWDEAELDLEAGRQRDALFGQWSPALRSKDLSRSAHSGWHPRRIRKVALLAIGQDYEIDV